MERLKVGVISPILANIYLNELDWELEKEGIHFVRYCDDFLLFAKTEEEIRKASEVAKRVIESLGLEVAINKTKFVDFNNCNFKFVGFEFNHWRESKKGVFNAIKANEKYGQKSHCNIKCFSKKLHKMDMYIRQRLRLCMQHKHHNMKRAWLMISKWNIEYFCKKGLIPCNWLYYNKIYGYTIEQYIEKQTSKNKKKTIKHIEKMKQKGLEYYDNARLNKMRSAGVII